MPSARADDFRRAALRLGVQRQRKTGSHERWTREDGRAVTIPIHGGREIGPHLYRRMPPSTLHHPEEFQELLH